MKVDLHRYDRVLQQAQELYQRAVDLYMFDRGHPDNLKKIENNIKELLNGTNTTNL